MSGKKLRVCYQYYPTFADVISLVLYSDETFLRPKGKSFPFLSLNTRWLITPILSYAGFVCIFAYHLVLKGLKQNVILSSFGIPKVLKKCHKNLGNRLTNKHFMAKNNLD